MANTVSKTSLSRSPGGRHAHIPPVERPVVRRRLLHEGHLAGEEGRVVAGLRDAARPVPVARAVNEEPVDEGGLLGGREQASGREADEPRARRRDGPVELRDALEEDGAVRVVPQPPLGVRSDLARHERGLRNEVGGLIPEELDPWIEGLENARDGDLGVRSRGPVVAVKPAVGSRRRGAQGERVRPRTYQSFIATAA